MNLRYHLWILIILVSHFSFSQNENQDEVYLSKIKLYKGLNNDSLLFYSKKLIKTSNNCLKYVGKIHEALSIYNTGEYYDSEKLTVQIIEELNDKDELCLIKTKIEALNRLFWIKKNQLLYNEALNNLLQIEKDIQRLPKDSSFYFNIQITLKLNTALIKYLLGNFEEARKLWRECLVFRSNSNRDTVMSYSEVLNKANTFNLIGESFLNETDASIMALDSASFYFKKGYETAKLFNPPHQNSESIYNLREAEILIAKKEYKKALELIRKYSKNAKQYNTYNNINSLKAICFYKLNKTDSSLFYSKKYLTSLANQKSNKKKLITIYDILSNEYYKSKVLDSAHKYSQLTIEEIKTLNENKNEVNKAYYLYDFKNAQKLNSSILQKEKQNRQILTVIYIIAGIVVFFIISYLIKRNKKITANLEEFKSEIENNSPASKREYEIDKDLEKAILNGIDELKNSNDFLNSDFTIKAFAKRLNTNTTYLSYFLNKNYNQSFKQLLTEKRIEFLIDKLEKDPNYRKYTIKSLGEEIGYTNDSSFTRAFKKLKGLTPSEFIKRLNSNT